MNSEPPASSPDRAAVVRGGDSAEREVSLKSGRAVAQALEEAPCEVLEYDTAPDLGQRLLRDEVEVVFVALHGPGGEDGTIQGLLDWIGIPYTGPGPAASALGMDKVLTRRYADALGVPSPEWFYLTAEESIHKKRDFPRMVVKPRFEGSSLGVSRVTEEDFEEAVERGREYGGDVLVEEYLGGSEATVGVVQLEETRILPPVGIHPAEGFYDYEAKYTPGMTEFRVPADLPGSTMDHLRSMTRRFVTELGAEALCRVDFRLDEGGKPRLLEINTIPGMTETSLLPRAASAAGLEFQELVWSMVRAAWGRSRWDDA